MPDFDRSLDTDIINAAVSGDVARIDELVAKGANPNGVDRDGGSALSWAAFYGNFTAVNALLRHGANVNLKDGDSETALSYAASKEYVDIMDLLLRRRADPYIVNSMGWNVLSWAASKGHVAVVQALLKFGVDTNVKDGQGLTAFSHALNNEHQEITHLISEHNAAAFVAKCAVFKKQYLDTQPYQRKKVLAESGHLSDKKQTQTLATPEIAHQPRTASNSAPSLYSAQLKEHLDALLKLIGLNNVKLDVTQSVNFLRVQQLRREKGLSAPQQSLHMVFTGNPGTGKTTIARLIAQIYNSLGILSKGQFVETDRAGLVGGYLGQTAIKTQEAVESAIGGVLFIDEAYSLTDDVYGRDMYGQEAVATLLKLMEDHRDDLIVIVAGYTEPMQKFIRSNPGLQSRFNRFLHFDDYAPADLTKIFRHFAESGDYTLHPATELKLTNVFAALHARRDETFGNARLARNLFEKAINAHANRMVSAGAVDEASLVTLYPEDIPDA